MSERSGVAAFSQRNVFYLRTSPYAVLQTILYLDHRHVAWFNKNPHVFQKVLEVLRARIMPKLRREADSEGRMSNMSKKEKVDVYSDSEYQLAYFFRCIQDRHAVLLKEKTLVFPNHPALSSVKLEDESDNVHAPIPHPSGSTEQRCKTSQQASKRIDNGESDLESDDENDITSFLNDPGPDPLFRGTFDGHDTMSTSPRPKKRARLDPLVKSEAEDVIPVDDQNEAVVSQQGQQDGRTEQDAHSVASENDSITDDPENAAIEVTEEDEQKMKSKLHVRYSGFKIFGKLLVLVIEPSKRVIAANPELFGEKKVQEIRQLSVAPMAPPLLSNNRQASVIQSRFTSIEPKERSYRNASLTRSRTPLFRGMTPASEMGTPAPMSLPSRHEEEEDEGGCESRMEEEGQEDLEGIELATQMLEREELSVGGGNDIDDGD